MREVLIWRKRIAVFFFTTFQVFFDVLINILQTPIHQPRPSEMEGVIPHHVTKPVEVFDEAWTHPAVTLRRDESFPPKLYKSSTVCHLERNFVEILHALIHLPGLFVGFLVNGSGE